MATITKFGSCVSRDIMNFLDPEKYVTKHTVTGVNISTINAPADLPIVKEDIHGKSNFSKRMQMLCLQHKDLSSFLSETKADYFLFDLADERLPLQKWKYGKEEAMIPVTWETYQTSKKLLENPKYPDLSISDWHFPDREKELYQNEIANFCDEILKYYDEEHIIYISLRQIQKYIEGGRIKDFENCEHKGVEKKEFRDRQNRVIEYAESILKEKMKGIWWIEMPQNSLGDARHHFDLHPLHYNHYVYEYFAECIAIIAKNRDEGLSDLRKNQIINNITFRKKYAEIKLDELVKLYE